MQEMQAIFIQIILLIVFLAVLVFSANLAVDAISKFSREVGISELSSGLVIVAVSTSLPEVTVAIFSSTTGNMGISLGNVFGSNVTNIALIAALLLIVSPVRRLDDRKMVVSLSRQLLLVSLIPFLLLVVRADGRIIGVGLLIIFTYFVYNTIRTGRNKKEHQNENDPGSPFKHLLIFFVTIAFVVLAARIVVESASAIAATTGVRESIIGASIVALGTSLPELSVDMVAAKKGHMGLALGDIIGSCVTNIALVLGIALALATVTTDFRILTEMISFAIGAPLVMFVFIRKGRISKWHGIVLLLIYAAFLAVMVETQVSLASI